MDILALGAVAKALVVPGETEDIIDAEGGGPQDIRLQGHPITVPGNHLEHGLDAHEFEMDTGGQGGHAGHGGLVVRDIHRIHMVFDHHPFFLHLFGHGTPGRTAFRGDAQMSGLENLFQCAFRIQLTHIFTSSLVTVLGPPARSVDQSLMGATCS